LIHGTLVLGRDALPSDLCGLLLGVWEHGGEQSALYATETRLKSSKYISSYVEKLYVEAVHISKSERRNEGKERFI